MFIPLTRCVSLLRSFCIFLRLMISNTNESNSDLIGTQIIYQKIVAPSTSNHIFMLNMQLDGHGHEHTSSVSHSFIDGIDVDFLHWRVGNSAEGNSYSWRLRNHSLCSHSSEQLSKISLPFPFLMVFSFVRKKEEKWKIYGHMVSRMSNDMEFNSIGSIHSYRHLMVKHIFTMSPTATHINDELSSGELLRWLWVENEPLEVCRRNAMRV